MGALEHHIETQSDKSSRMFWYRLRWNAVRSHLPAGAFDLIDVGAGSGFLGDYLHRDRPLATYGFIEPIESMQARLRQRFGDDADRETVKGAQAVTMLDVIEHQEDDRDFLFEHVLALEDGATLIVTVPALQKLWSSWDELLGHYRRYDRASLLRVIDGMPLRVKEVSYLFPELIPMAWFRARRNPGGSVVEDPEAGAELPDLPGPLNEILYGVGSVSLALRKLWPRGTSLLLAAEVAR